MKTPPSYSIIACRDHGHKKPAKPNKTKEHNHGAQPGFEHGLLWICLGGLLVITPVLSLVVFPSLPSARVVGLGACCGCSCSSLRWRV